MPRTLKRLVLLVALAAPFAMPAAPAQAGQGMEVALQDDPVFAYGYYYDRQRALQHAYELQATRIRVNVLWSVVLGRQANKTRKPRRLRYNFSYYDPLINEAAAYGIKVQLGLTGPAPRFATGNRKLGGRRPSPRFYRDFVRAAAQHFRGRVDRYSIWNEPNYVSWISPQKQAGSIYRRLYTTGYGMIKRIDSAAQVLIAETSPHGSRGRSIPPLKFLRSVTCANRSYRRARSCGTLRADGYAHHAYEFTKAPSASYPGRDNVTIGTLSRLTTALDKLARARLLTNSSGGALDVYVTEFGYLQSGSRRLPQSRRASYLVQAFDIAQRNPRVRQMLNYLLVQPTRKYRFFDTSLVNLRGSPFAPYGALAEWARQAAADGRIVAPVPPSSGDGGGGDGGGGDGGGGGGEPPPSESPPPSGSPPPRQPPPPPPGNNCPLPPPVPCPGI